MDENLEPLLNRYKLGDVAALDELFVKLAPNLKTLARQYLRGQPHGVTQQSTALLHDLFLRLRNHLEYKLFDHKSVDHLFARLAIEMKSMVREQGRAAYRQKRGGNAIPHSLSDGDVVDNAFSRFENLNNALDVLKREDSQAFVAFVFRTQMGLTAAETASLLGVSQATIFRDSEFAKDFLKSHLGNAGMFVPRHFVAKPQTGH